MNTNNHSNVIAANSLTYAESFIITKEYKQFEEFCESCRKYKYIGLCYGSPGVGKSLSARHYANWDAIEEISNIRDAPTKTIEALSKSNTVLYTPSVVVTPGQIVQNINRLRSGLQSILLEKVSRKHRSQLDKALEEDQVVREERIRKLLPEINWFANHIDEKKSEHHKEPKSKYAELVGRYYLQTSKITDPTTLVIIDEADRLKMTALEQVRDIFDKGGIGVILIGMPGIEKRLARYPQLYSRVGFVHTFRTLSATAVQELLLQHNWRPKGAELTLNGVEDKEVLSSIIRITGGNFRLIHRLLTQSSRIMEVNELSTITSRVVEAARESLVIGTT